MEALDIDREPSESIFLILSQPLRVLHYLQNKHNYSDKSHVAPIYFHILTFCICLLFRLCRCLLCLLSILLLPVIVLLLAHPQVVLVDIERIALVVRLQELLLTLLEVAVVLRHAIQGGSYYEEYFFEADGHGIRIARKHRHQAKLQLQLADRARLEGKREG